MLACKVFSKIVFGIMTMMDYRDSVGYISLSRHLSTVYTPADHGTRYAQYHYGVY